MRNKLFMATLAAAIAVPVMVVPIPNQYAEAAETKGSVVLANNPFKDVRVNSPYYKIIHEMRDAGIIQGYEDGTFRPDTTISRQHAAALVSRALKINDLTLEKTKEFKQPKDLRTDSPYYEDIKMLVEAGLLEMNSQGNVNPNKALTRGEMAKIITVAFNLEVKADYVFADVKGSKYEEYVKALYSNGVTTGYEDYTFKLDGSLTRVHYVLFMYRAMNIDADFVAEPIPAPKPTPTPKPKPETKPDPTPTSKSPVKYSDWSYQDIKTKIPRPVGYVAGEHEKKNEAIVQKITEENGHGYMTSYDIEANSPTWSPAFTFEDNLRLSAKHVGASYEEFVKIINQVIETGEVHNGETFTVYFNYQNGRIYVSGVRNHTK
ncbi:S-layer homology domain-containing protein [Lysinibacillus capsici]|uniref:S-layer homology domain-containing protein n=1 Tax=Lysinibacillus capsici TaxID=2115968 RepID=UPI0034E4D15C